MALSSGNILDPYILTEQQLLDIYNSAIQHIKDGKIMLNWGGEGTNAGHAISMPAQDVAREARWALKSKNPKKYGYLATSSRVFFA